MNRLNGILRNLLSFIFWITTRMILAHQFFERLRFKKVQKKLRTQLRVDQFPVQDFDAQKELLASTFASFSEPKTWAYTSGTRKEPKAIPFDLKRTRLLQKIFLKSMMIITSPYKGKKTFFVFSSLNEDNSLTANLSSEKKSPGHIELLQAPYRYLQTRNGQKLRRLVGDDAARVILLIVTRPRFLYSTNPSTLTHFILNTTKGWNEISAGIRKVLSEPVALKDVLSLSDGDAFKRLQMFSARETPPAIAEILSELNAVITWDGGYVKPFLEQLRSLLPGKDLLPMYSMSTETIETLPHRLNGELCFLPISPGTSPEFLELETSRILLPEELETGKNYGLIVSDVWGLRRYDTMDIFLVKNMFDGIPDLAFLKRRGINSSLTGEKLTEEQIVLLTLSIKQVHPELLNHSFSMFPVSSQGKFGYELALIGDKVKLDIDQFSRSCDKMLGEINSEYKSKIDSGRLEPLVLSFSTPEMLADRMGKRGHWESQFKILPLYDKLITKF